MEKESPDYRQRGHRPKVIQDGKVSFIPQIGQVINDVVEQYGNIDIRQGKRNIDRKEYRVVREHMPEYGRPPHGEQNTVDAHDPPQFSFGRIAIIPDQQ